MENEHTSRLHMQQIRMCVMPAIVKTVTTLSRIFLSFLLLLVLATGAAAQDTKPAVEPNPLRTADTSSPRDTLRSFLSDTNQMMEEFGQDKRTEKFYRAYRRASQTFDFSHIREGDSWFIRTRSIAQLYELLARIQLPPENKIPGDSEVADGTITEWTLPNTSITISKLKEGPRAGDFLFSAHTIQQLDGLYRQARDLPYKRGATGGFFEEIMSLDTSVLGQEQELRTRLESVDTSSPRSTLEGFLDHVNRAYKLVTETDAGLQAKPPTVTRKEATEAERAAANYLRRASDALDLSQVPQALREYAGIEIVLLLKEVFDRMLLPPVDSIPNAQMIADARKAASGISSKPARAIRWKLPTGQIEIVEILEGDRQGQFLFSANTVKNIAEVYKKIKDLPYRQERFGGIELEYLSPGLSPGFYERYVAASGYLIPKAHLMGRLIDSLPGWFKAVYGGQMVWQWAGLLLSALFAVMVSLTLFRYIRLLAKSVRSPVHEWLNVLAPVLVLLIIIAVGKFIDYNLNFTGNLQAIVKTAISSIAIVLAAWVAMLLFKAVAETIVATSRMRYLTSESALLRIGASVIGFLASVWILVGGIRALGTDLIPLLAGLGIGGLAVAFAAQSTIANFIGGLILLANKPVQVGDFCRYGEDPAPDWMRVGTIEEINWLSTRIRGLDRTVTTIPNAEFAGMHIVNLTKRDQRLLHTVLQLRYETTPDQMRYILAGLRGLLLGHPKVTDDPARVRLVGYGAYSKDIEIFAYLLCQDQNTFLAIQEDILLRVENIINEAGSGFAFPSQTTYLSRDKGLDAGRGSNAEKQVEQWRAGGKLPFPEFEDDERRQLKDTLDYPPEGSPDYKPPGAGT